VSGDRARRVRELFDGALPLAGEKRATWLSRECAGDPELRAEVDSLLAEDPLTRDLPVPPLIGAAEPSRGRPLPESIAGYRVVRELGAGGMGVVYEVEQKSPRRRVALKVIRGGALADETRRRMFRREAESLARLDHPGIATIHESGEADDGQPYLVMELVRGEPLDVWLTRTAARRARGGPALATDLRLFRLACDAVSYAHQRGVIHRDLKPSNILVVGDEAAGADSGSAPSGPSVKILDFGLARLADEDAGVSVGTQVGAIRGTLQYMSPEQAGGDPADVDLRSDVYSLGVVLYELVTGERPYDVSGVPIVEALRVVREEPPRPVRGAGRGLDADLEIIVLTALAKDPTDRYQSAHALGEDLDRWLTGQPILARPPSTLYQLRKLVARNRIPFALAGAAVLAVVAVAVWTSWLYARAERNLERALAAEVTSAREASTAKRVSDFLVEVFQVADPTGDAPETVTARELLDEAAVRIDTELATEPEVRAALMLTMGRAYTNLGVLDRAGELLERSLEDRRERYGADAPEALEPQLDLAVLWFYQGRYEDSQAGVAEVLAIEERTLGPDDPALVLTLDTLASIVNDLGETVRAESLSTRAIGIAEAVADPDREQELLLAQALNNSGTRNNALGKRAEAEEALLRSLAIRERLLGPDHPRVARVLNNLAEVYRHEPDRAAEAESLFLRALEISERTLGPDHASTAYPLNNLAFHYKRMGRYDEAEPLYLRALAVRQDKLPPDHQLIAWTHATLGMLYLAAGRLEESEVALGQALAVAERAFGADDRRYAPFLGNLGRLREAQGRPAEAEVLFARRDALRE